MQAEQSLREGNLDAALLQLQEQVRNDPANSAYRVFLFQLLSVAGQWPRALTQLDVAGELDAGTLAMVQTYREALRCEALREDVFAGKRLPLLFGDPGEWAALVFEALKLSAENRHDTAQELRERAYELMPATAGTCNGEPFEWIADADSRIGPFVEAIVNGNYYWIPFSHIARIRFEEPEDLRDLVWMPAQFTWTNEGEAVGLVFARYPDSQRSEDPYIRLARKTEWQDMGDEVYHGTGQKLFATDATEFPLFEIRDLVLQGSGDTGPG